MLPPPKIRREIVVFEPTIANQKEFLNERYEYRCHCKTEHETVKVIYYVIMIVIASEANPETMKNETHTPKCEQKIPPSSSVTSRIQSQLSHIVWSEHFQFRLIGLCVVILLSMLAHARTRVHPQWALGILGIITISHHWLLCVVIVSHFVICFAYTAHRFSGPLVPCNKTKYVLCVANEEDASFE